ncbi:MAG: NADP-dependent malic enzyme [Ignavibacteria bacterium]|nr:NADP-dependent malic enzyme [Ignavibacteria bacterium]
MKLTKKEALEYHSTGRKGKIEVVPTKPCLTQRDLSLAYTPGVADPCLEIHDNPETVYEYTAKGNLVAVISNGTAVLGLGDIGPEAGKPVMEGKGVLFKRFADIDVFDIELRSKDINEIIRCVEMLEPTFGGINLEDIKAPECFYIEEALKKSMKIPVFHDDQHGTAIISGAAMLNACEISGKDISKIKVVFNGAGASANACANLYIRLGVKKENILMCDTKGVIYLGRTAHMNEFKEAFAVETDRRTLAEALVGADVFVGLSVGNVVTKDMVRSMAKDPIVFAMANPTPEISYEDAVDARPDVIMATGRSDYPNQINNVLGFPFIFRGALDVRASAINEEMKIAASYALAALAKEEVPEMVKKAYGGQEIEFGKEYIVPKPFDPRVLTHVAPAIAKAAMDTGVATKPIEDFEAYREELLARLGISKEIVRRIIDKAKLNPKRIVFPEGEQVKILKAAHILVDEGIAKPIIVGNKARIDKLVEEHHINTEGFEFVDHENFPELESYAEELYKLRRRRGLLRHEVYALLKNTNYFGSMMVHMGHADGMISGMTSSYPNTIKPALHVVKLADDVKKVSGCYMVIVKNKLFFFADTSVNVDPNAEELAEIAIQTAKTAKRFGVEPKVAMLSFSNFGSAPYPQSVKVAKATELVKKQWPELAIDGEMQADTAVVPEILAQQFPFVAFKGPANVLIFPDLASGNIAYKLMARIGGAEVIGPILMGLSKAVHVLQKGAEVNDVVNMTAIAVVEAQEKK